MQTLAGGGAGFAGAGGAGGVLLVLVLVVLVLVLLQLSRVPVRNNHLRLSPRHSAHAWSTHGFGTTSNRRCRVQMSYGVEMAMDPQQHTTMPHTAKPQIQKTAHVSKRGGRACYNLVHRSRLCSGQ
jgi:hypothetical protein